MYIATVLAILASASLTAGDTSGDGQITVNEIIMAVNSALDSCASGE